RWKTNTASGGGDTVWTNDTSGGNQVLENIDQTSNLALLDYNAGNVLFSTFGGYYPLDGKNNTILGNTWPDASSQTNLVAIGNLAVNAMSASLSTVAIGNQPANAVTNDSQSIFIGTLTGLLGVGRTKDAVFLGNFAHSSSVGITNAMAIGA